MAEVLVIGAGLAGLVAGWQAAVAGAQTRVICAGWGAQYWQPGCIDVLGYHPPDTPEPLSVPGEGLARLIDERPDHPYARLGVEGVAGALDALGELFGRAGYPLHGSLGQNWLLPSAAGAFRPTCLAAATMVSGDLRRSDPMLIVGFRQLPDFYSALVAANLSAQGVPAQAITLDLARLRRRRFTTTSLLAGLFEEAAFRQEVVEAVSPAIGEAARVGFPAVLGMQRPIEVIEDLEQQLKRAVFEIPTLPASVPGMRLHSLLVTAIEEAGGSVFQGMEAVGAAHANGRITAVRTEAAARRRVLHADAFVLASGGILGGGVVAGSDGSVAETVFGLPLVIPSQWFQREFLHPAGHPIYRAGLEVDGSLRPTDSSGRVVHQNLFAAGAVLAHGELLRERSLDGVAVATGWLAGRRAAETALADQPSRTARSPGRREAGNL
jgi:glycerol-3-phosphate dehydrogenase subunit B